MITGEEKHTSISSEEEFPLYFNDWLKRRREELDLTQVQLAKRASCSVFAIRKIELGERRPSRQLAELLAKALEIPSEEQAIFVKVARGELGIERLASPAQASARDFQPATIPGNLPRELTPFIGREPELSALGQLLADGHCSLITIVGPGGIGKTRLAVAAAQQTEERFLDGVWFVPLVSLKSPDQIVPAIAAAVDFRFQDPTNLQAQFLRYLRTKKTLLVLDNAEHLLDGVEVFIELIQGCPQVKLLVTSRERLNLLSEWVFEIQGLPVPPNDRVESFEAYSSVALFLHSARRVRAGFELRDAERQWVLKICQIMEGMPLGIELSAAWVGLLSCEEIAREIELNLDFLSVSMRDLPERHRSLRATLDYSWQRLSVKEQQALSQLSVFRGGFTRKAAEQVAGASLSVLSTLVNRTLLRRVAPGRYELHEFIRQYCAAHLVGDPQAHAATQKRHYDCFLALAEAAEQELKGRDQIEWLGRLEHEHDNLQAALEWALENDHTAPDRDDKALRLSGALRWFWRMRGHFQEGLSWLTRSLQQHPEGHTAARAVALFGKSLLLFAVGDLNAACHLAEESAVISRELGDQRSLADALSLMGYMLFWRSKADLGQVSLREALTIYRKSGDRWGEARTLYRLGSCLADYGGDPTGRAMLQESAAILEDLQEKFILTGVLTSLGIDDQGLGDYASARARLEQALALAREIGLPWGAADALTNLGCVYRILGEYSTAQSLLEQALKFYQEHVSSIWEIDVRCALAENALSAGDLSTARFHLQEASRLSASGDNKWLQMLVGYFHGLLALYEGDGVAAVMLLEETTARAREGQFKPDLARSLVALGRVKRTLGQVLPASALLTEGLDLFRALGHKLGIAYAIDELGAVSAIQGNSLQAARLFSTAYALRGELGVPIPPVDRAAFDSAVAACRAQLGETAFTEAWAHAASRPFQEVVEEVLKPGKN